MMPVAAFRALMMPLPSLELIDAVAISSSKVGSIRLRAPHALIGRNCVPDHVCPAIKLGAENILEC
jgi:hypothetical protein